MDGTMNEIVIISGKGGTGKTSVAAALLALANNRFVAADCDVDAADLHLVLDPGMHTVETMAGGRLAHINPDLCTSCGRCASLCRFEAISTKGRSAIPVPIFEISPFACEGCGVCARYCSFDAIEMVPRVAGELYVSSSRLGPFVHARLNPGADNSGKLVTKVREAARKIAEEQQLDGIIIDGPPGIGCPVIASITGASKVLIVTEATLSGEHDMERIAQLTVQMKIPTFLVVNKFDIAPDIAGSITFKAKQHGITILPGLPWDPVFSKAQREQKSLPEFAPSSPLVNTLRAISEAVMQS